MFVEGVFIGCSPHQLGIQQSPIPSSSVPSSIWLKGGQRYADLCFTILSNSHKILRISQGIVVLYAEFRRHLGKAGMTINDFAAYLCIRPASVSNYSKSGSVPRTYAIIAILLGEAADRGVNGPQLLGNFGISPHAVPAGSNVKQLDMFRASRVPSASAGERKRRSAIGKDSAGSQGAAGVHQAGRRL